MNVTERRKHIINLLKQSDAPISAKELAVQFHVSRQVIVQDMAVIRVSHPGILSTYRGYLLQIETGCSREIKVRHTDEQAGDELNLIVDLGGRVQNVSISHKFYGRVTAEMNISSRQDVSEYVAALLAGESSLLSNATGGYHYHLVEAGSEERLDMIEAALKSHGFLAPLSPWELEQE
ncbi:MAG: transcription repressor NadR [Evtepia sp.]